MQQLLRNRDYIEKISLVNLHYAKKHLGFYFRFGGMITNVIAFGRGDLRLSPQDSVRHRPSPLICLSEGNRSSIVSASLPLICPIYKKDAPRPKRLETFRSSVLQKTRIFVGAFFQSIGWCVLSAMFGAGSRWWVLATSGSDGCRRANVVIKTVLPPLCHVTPRIFLFDKPIVPNI